MSGEVVRRTSSKEASGNNTIKVNVGDTDGSILLANDKSKQMTTQKVGIAQKNGKVDDSAIHVMESKRDEIAQMQWRVVREQFSDSQRHMNSMVTQLSAVSEQVEQTKLLIASSEEKVRCEMHTGLLAEASDRRLQQDNVTNRIEAIAQALYHEQGAREMLSAQMSKQMDIMKELLEQEKQQRLTDITVVRRDLEFFRQELKVEKKEVDTMVLQYSSDGKAVAGRCDDLKRALTEEMQNREAMQTRMIQDFKETTKNLEKDLMRLQGNVHNMKTEVGSRIDGLEGRSTQYYENFVADLEQKGQGMQQVNQKLESVLNDLTRERGDRLKVQATVNSNSELLQTMSTQFNRIDEQTQEWKDLGPQHFARIDQHRSLSNDVSVCSGEVHALSKIVNSWAASAPWTPSQMVQQRSLPQMGSKSMNKVQEEDNESLTSAFTMSMKSQTAPIVKDTQDDKESKARQADAYPARSADVKAQTSPSSIFSSPARSSTTMGAPLSQSSVASPLDRSPVSPMVMPSPSQSSMQGAPSMGGSFTQSPPKQLSSFSPTPRVASASPGPIPSQSVSLKPAFQAAGLAPPGQSMGA